MEHLVVGIANINFQHSFDEILLEKHSSNPTSLPLSRNFINMNVSALPVTEESLESEKDLNNSNESDDSFSPDHEEPSCSSASSSSVSSRRNLPTRACKENSLRIKRRSIMKPAKRDVSKTTNFSLLCATDIKKIYLNKNLSKFRPTNLETIFEESQDESSQVRLVGLRKMKRSLSCSDGFNINKTLTKQRRARIKKIFGRRIGNKKISLNDFLERLNKSIEGNADVDDPNAQSTEVMSSTSTTSNFDTMECLC